MHLTGPIRRTAGLLLTACVLAACTGGNDANGTSDAPLTNPPTTSPIPAPTTVSPSTTAGVAPSPFPSPTVAPAMSNNDAAGAIAAAQYFIDLTVYMRTSGDTDALTPFITDACTFCKDFTSDVAAAYQQGSFFTGGAIVLKDPQATFHTSGGYSVQAAAEAAASREVRADGTTKDFQARVKDPLVVGVKFVDGIWYLIDIGDSIR